MHYLVTNLHEVAMNLSCICGLATVVLCIFWFLTSIDSYDKPAHQQIGKIIPSSAISFAILVILFVLTPPT